MFFLMNDLWTPPGVETQKTRDLRQQDQDERERRDAVAANLWEQNKALMRKQLRARHRQFKFYLLPDGHVTELSQIERLAREKNTPVPIFLHRLRALQVTERQARQAYRQTNPLLIALDRQPLPSQLARRDAPPTGLVDLEGKPLR